MSQAHVLEAEVVVDHEHVSPPVLLADVGVRVDNQPPLGAGAEVRQDEGAEQDQRGQRREQPANKTRTY